jgi:Flp pilus assembly protein CpaB
MPPGAVRKSKRLLLVALLLGLLAAILNWASSSRVSNLTVLKAKKQILAGTPVTDSMFDRVTISGDLKEMRGLVVDAADFAKAFRNRPVVETLEPGQLLMLRSFDISGDDVRASIGQGKRAISIEVPDEAQAVAYFVRPGDSVDVWGWVNNTAQPLKEGACVRAVGEAASGSGEREGGEGRYRTVTLVVSETDVRGLVSNLALAENKIRLSLVGHCDPSLEKPAMKAFELPQSAKGGGAGGRLEAALADEPSDSSAPLAAEPPPALPRKRR